MIDLEGRRRGLFQDIFWLLPSEGYYSGLAVRDMNRLRAFECWGPRFDNHSRNGCLCAFILFVLFCMQVDAHQKGCSTVDDDYDDDNNNINIVKLV
jgi:hypothetical protein